MNNKNKKLDHKVQDENQQSIDGVIFSKMRVLK